MDEWIYILITIISSIVVPIIVTSIGNKANLTKTKEEIRGIFEKKYNENRWDLYLNFINIVQKMLGHAGADRFPWEEFYPSLDDIGMKIMLISSDSVVELYGSWRLISSVNGMYDLQSLRLLFKLINELRKDLGNEASTLDLDKLLKCVVPNYRRSM